MSRVTYITDHKDAAKARLLQQYKGKVKFEGAIDSYIGTQTQSIEDALEDFYDKLNIDVSEGTQLDNIGTIVGISRSGYDDATYRVLLKAQIANNVSEGTVENVINLWGILTGANITFVHEAYPAEVNITTTGAPTTGLETLTYLLMQDALGAGIRLNGITIFDEDEAFSFDGNANDTALGFGDALDAGVGGKFAALLDTGIDFSFAGDSQAGGFSDINDPLVGGGFNSL